jgi:hypothetical protein
MPEVRLKWRYRSRRTVFWQNHREGTTTKHWGRGADKGRDTRQAGLETRGAMNYEPRITRMGTDEDRDTQGCAWTSQAGAVVSNPFTSKLARDCEPPSPILLRKWPCFAQKSLGKTPVCAWFPSGEML